MLGKRMEARTGEAMTKELSLPNSKFTLAQANCEAMNPAQLQKVLEVLNMRVKLGLKMRMSSI